MIRFSTSYTLFCILNEISLISFPLLAAYYSSELSYLFAFVSIYEFLIALFFGVIIGYLVDRNVIGSIYLASILLLLASLLFYFSKESSFYIIIIVILYGFGKCILSSIFSKLTKLISDDRGDYKFISELNVKIRSLVDIIGPLISAFFIISFSEEIMSLLMVFIVLCCSYLMIYTRLPKKIERPNSLKIKFPSLIMYNVATVSIWNLGYCALYVNISYFLMSKGEDYITQTGLILSCVGIGGLLSFFFKKINTGSVLGLIFSLLWSSLFFTGYDFTTIQYSLLMTLLGLSQALFNIKSMAMFYEVVEEKNSSYLFGFMSSANSLALLIGAYVAITPIFEIQLFSFSCLFLSLILHIITKRKFYDWKNTFSIKYSS